MSYITDPLINEEGLDLSSEQLRHNATLQVDETLPPVESILRRNPTLPLALQEYTEFAFDLCQEHEYQVLTTLFTSQLFGEQLELAQRLVTEGTLIFDVTVITRLTQHCIGETDPEQTSIVRLIIDNVTIPVHLDVVTTPSSLNLCQHYHTEISPRVITDNCNQHTHTNTVTIQMTPLTSVTHDVAVTEGLMNQTLIYRTSDHLLTIRPHDRLVSTAQLERARMILSSQ